MTYKTAQGEALMGASPLDIVTALRDGGRFTADQSIEDYMAGFAARMLEWDKSRINYASPETFVADLERVGYLTKVD